MAKTLLILNPHAAGGQAQRMWESIEPLIRQKLPELTVVITQRIEDVDEHVRQAYHTGIEQVIGMGGDGTNHTIVNALIRIGEQESATKIPTFGTLPLGTGRDWARSRGIPFKLESAVNWIINATPRPTDVGLLHLNDEKRYFLNIASAGLGGEVDAKVNQVMNRRPWTFLKATIQAMLTYDPQQVQVKLDGEDWYEGKSLVTVVANGTTFGHGMIIAPNAKINDGVFDVVLVEGMSKLTALAAFGRVYNGSHLSHPRVHSKSAKQVEITCASGQIALDLDGEYTRGHHLHFELKPKLLQLLT